MARQTPLAAVRPRCRIGREPFRLPSRLWGRLSLLVGLRAAVRSCRRSTDAAVQDLKTDLPATTRCRGAWPTRWLTDAEGHAASNRLRSQVIKLADELPNFQQHSTATAIADGMFLSRADFGLMRDITLMRSERRVAFLALRSKRRLPPNSASARRIVGAASRGCDVMAARQSFCSYTQDALLNGRPARCRCIASPAIPAVEPPGASAQIAGQAGPAE